MNVGHKQYFFYGGFLISFQKRISNTSSSRHPAKYFIWCLLDFSMVYSLHSLKHYHLNMRCTHAIMSLMFFQCVITVCCVHANSLCSVQHAVKEWVILKRCITKQGCLSWQVIYPVLVFMSHSFSRFPQREEPRSEKW